MQYRPLNVNTVNLLMIHIFLLIIILPHAIAQNQSETFSILEKLYYATNGPHWKNNQGWLENENFCSWAGVKCDRSQNIKSKHYL